VGVTRLLLDAPPNPRVQRTRVLASLGRSPLTRRPFGIGLTFFNSWVLFEELVIDRGFGSGTNRAQVSPGTNAEINFKLSAGPVTAQVEVTDKGCILETRCRVVVSVRRSL